MHSAFHLVGADRTLEVFGVRLIGVSALNAKRLLFTLVLILVLLAIRWILRRTSRLALVHRQGQAGIGIASSTIVVTGMPELRVRTNEERPPDQSESTH
jgi:hypothetical protein